MISSYDDTVLLVKRTMAFPINFHSYKKLG